MNKTNNFGGSDVELKYSDYKKSKVVLLPCPYEGTVTYRRGCSKGPSAILEASANMELFDDELKKETYRIGISTKKPLKLSSLSPEKVVTTIKKEVSKILEHKKMPIVLGGEHSVSIGAVWAVSELYKNVSILHLDAHYDLRDKYEGSIYNHACAARRFLDYCPLVEAGVRSLSKKEEDFINTKPPNLEIFDIYSILKNPDWKNAVLKSLNNDVYISIDMDVPDPSVMPSVGTPEPGGLSWYQLLDLLNVVSKNKRVTGFDVVELMPLKDVAAPDFLTSKLIYRLLGYIFS